MDDSSASRRRRGVGHVTQIACTECRKKRAKCDGQNPCGRCAAQVGVDCVYEPHVRQSKDDMRAEIEELRTAQRQTEKLIAALISQDKSSVVLGHLREGQSVDEITTLLEKLDQEATAHTTFRQPSDEQAIGGALLLVRNMERSPSSTIALSDSQTWTSGPNSTNLQARSLESRPLIGGQETSPRSWSPIVGSADHRQQGQNVILGSRGESLASHRWTNVTSDLRFIDHIMVLYFCWEYPTFASLNKEHFLEDYRTGTTRYCSSLLVNSILALGCRFSSQPQARADPNDHSSAGAHFFAEAERLLDLEGDRHSLTTIQALGLMSLREASCGRASESLYLSGQSIRLAIELGLHKDTQNSPGIQGEIDHEVRSATFWGAFSLDQAWALSTGRLPHFSHDLSLVNKPSIVHHVEASAWIPYTDDGAPLERPCTQPSNVRSVFKSFCELSETIHKSLYAMYAPGTEVTGKRLLAVYREYLHWYDGLTPVLRLGQNFTPSVLFAHMHYHYAIMLLFRPFIKLKITASSVSPRDVCAQTSDAICALVRSYDQLYSLRRTPSFVPFFVLAASITQMALISVSQTGPEKLRQCLEDLKAMTHCHAHATKALSILSVLIVHWKIQGISDEETKELHDLVKMCRPRSNSLNHFCPKFDEPLAPTKLTETTNDNPIFWPFPLQGRPLLDIHRLKDCGFYLPTDLATEDESKDEKMDIS